MNPEASNLHLNEPERNDSDGYGRILDFRNIDYLEVDIKSVAHMEIHGAPPWQGIITRVRVGAESGLVFANMTGNVQKALK